MEEHAIQGIEVHLNVNEIQWILRSLILTIDDLDMQMQYEKGEAKHDHIMMQEQIDALWKENAKLRNACEVVKE